MLKEFKFEWNDSKDRQNLDKHGVSFSQATQAFKDINGIDLQDFRHSETEERLFWIGKIFDGRIITVRYTVRNETIRIIGAAEWRDFKKKYYEKTKIQ
jgi:uncharacterized protein